EREGISIEADQAKFAFGMLRHMVSGNKNIAAAPQVPVSIRFPTRACLQRLELLLLVSGRDRAGRPRRNLHRNEPNPIRPSISLFRYLLNTNLSSINRNPVVGGIFCGRGIWTSFS